MINTPLDCRIVTIDNCRSVMRRSKDGDPHATMALRAVRYVLEEILAGRENALCLFNSCNTRFGPAEIPYAFLVATPWCADLENDEGDVVLLPMCGHCYIRRRDAGDSLVAIAREAMREHFENVSEATKQ